MNVRTHGRQPYRVAVLHGGPGAAGEVRPVAERLSEGFGVLEPLQTATSVRGQVEELRAVLCEHGRLPITLIGYSWGAWLGYLVAGQHPVLVKKLIMVSSGAFEAAYAAGLMETRLARLAPDERARVSRLLAAMDDPAGEGRDAVLAEFGRLMSRADTYDRLPSADVDNPDEVRMDVYQGVWPEAAEMRKNGALLAAGKRIACPVVAIHGAYDPTPAEGVKEPLSRVLEDFRFILLEKCGHTPWIEKHAAAKFYTLLKAAETAT